jgi:zinc transport system permease protein
MNVFINQFQMLPSYFAMPIVQNAMIVGVLIAFCSSLLGVTLVLKRFSFIGNGLSNVAFGATAVAAAIGFNNNLLFALPVTVLSAVLLLNSKDTKIKGDAALAMISVSSLAIGYLVFNIFPRSANLAGDICQVLFGTTAILTLTENEVLLSIVLSALVIVVFVLFYHKIFAITFDEDFAAATGTRARTYNLLLSVVVGVIISLAMSLVGALLVSALVVFPALTAMRIYKTFKSVTICSVIVSVICAALGILISIITGWPVGSTIVVVNLAAFMLFSGIGIILRRGG